MIPLEDLENQYRTISLEQRLENLRQRRVETLSDAERAQIIPGKEDIPEESVHKQFSQFLEDSGIHIISTLGLARALYLFPDRGEIVGYVGVDCNKSDLHIGHGFGLMLIKLLLEDGWNMSVIAGTETAKIGDPSGRLDTRPILPDEVIEEYRARLTVQIRELLKPYSVPIIPNGVFHEDRPLLEYDILAEQFNVAGLLQSKIFRNRFEEHETDSSVELSLLEITYPLYQAADASLLGAYCQLGGEDQEGNLLQSRKLQKNLGLEPHISLLWPQVPGLGGDEKMSGSKQESTIHLTNGPYHLFSRFMQFKKAANREEVQEVFGKMLGMQGEYAFFDVAEELVAWAYDEELAAEVRDEFHKRTEAKEDLFGEYGYDLQYRESLEQKIAVERERYQKQRPPRRFNKEFQIGNMTFHGEWEDDFFRRWDKKQKRAMVVLSSTSPNLHLGHVKLLQELKKYKDHEIVVAFGDHTAKIGSIYEDGPPVELSEEEAGKNADSLEEQVLRVLGMQRGQVRFVRNSELFDHMSADSMLPVRRKINYFECAEAGLFRRSFDEEGKLPVNLLQLDYPVRRALGVFALQPDVYVTASQPEADFQKYLEEPLGLEQGPDYHPFSWVRSWRADSKMTNRRPEDAIHAGLSPYEIFARALWADDSRMEDYGKAIYGEGYKHFAEYVEEAREQQNWSEVMNSKKRLASDIVDTLCPGNHGSDARRVFEYYNMRCPEMSDKEISELEQTAREVVPDLRSEIDFEQNSVELYEIIGRMRGIDSPQGARAATKKTGIYVDGHEIKDPDAVIELGKGNILRVGKNKPQLYVL